MAEYISKDELLQYLEPLTNTPAIVIKRYVEDMEAVDVQPKKYGEWEIFYQNGKPKLKCTNCHSLHDIRTNDKHICIYPKFCEECGADMRGEQNENN